MKLRKGERITCAKGHHVGDVLADVQDGGPVPTDALSIDYAVGRGYVCERCDEVVAEHLGEDRWRIRTSHGWVS